MAKYDVFGRHDAAGFLLDCQADLLDDLNTRLVVPLVPEADAPRPASRLNPVFSLEGRSVVMVTQFAAAVHKRELGERICSLVDHSDEIGNALDMLISGF